MEKNNSNCSKGDGKGDDDRDDDVVPVDRDPYCDDGGIGAPYEADGEMVDEEAVGLKDEVEANDADADVEIDESSAAVLRRGPGLEENPQLPSQRWR